MESPILVKEDERKEYERKEDERKEDEQNNHENDENIDQEISPSPYSLSTITATGSVGCFINLKLFYDLVQVDPLNIEPKRDGFTYVELGKKDEQTFCKGFHKKMLVNHKTKIEGKRFDNQASTIIRLFDDITNTYKYQSLKVFFNGSIHLTGLKSLEQGHIVLEYLVEKLKEFKTLDSNVTYDEETFGHHALKSHNFQVRLINTDFKLNYCVNRRELDKVLSNYGLFHVFEAGSYPGVKISFYWNSEKTHQNGICECQNQLCMKKGKSKKPENLDVHIPCKKITIIVFQSGSVIITGAQELEQVDVIYTFINNIFQNERRAIQKHNLFPQLVKKYPKFSYDDITKKNKKVRLPKGYVLKE